MVFLDTKGLSLELGLRRNKETTQLDDMVALKPKEVRFSKVISRHTTNVFETRPIIKPKKLSIYGSMVEPRSNQLCNKYVI